MGEPGGSRPALKPPRLPELPRFMGVLGSLSIGTAGAKALLCRGMLKINAMVMTIISQLSVENPPVICSNAHADQFI